MSLLKARVQAVLPLALCCAPAVGAQLDITLFERIAQRCAPEVELSTLKRVVRVESGFNPFAIGVVNGQLARQPKDLDEAIATAKNLEKLGYNFSLGAGQVNRYNLPKYGETYDTIFDPCRNLRTSSTILKDCYTRAKARYKDEQKSLQWAFSCYYSGKLTNFQQEYVNKVLANAGVPAKPTPAVPAVKAAKADPATNTKAIPLAVKPTVAAKTMVEAKAQRASSTDTKTAPWVIFAEPSNPAPARNPATSKDDTNQVKVKLVQPRIVQVPRKQMEEEMSSLMKTPEKQDAPFVTIIQ